MSTDTTRPDAPRGAGAVGLFAMLLATLAAVALSVFGGYRHLTAAQEERRRGLAERQHRQARELGVLFVARVDAAVGGLDPLDALWDGVEPVELKLQKQTIAMPILHQATVETVRIRALTDGRLIAWRLSWDDPTPDANVDTGRFTDAVALQFPLGRTAPFTMGDHNHPVSILHWKALWQKDVDEHFQDVQDLHPNYWTDLYWFAEGEAPQRVPDDFTDRRSHEWFPAYQAGNPLADFHRTLPVEELAATGYGTLTPQQEQRTAGSGAWRDGGWHVVFVRPLRTEDPLDYQFWPGDRGSLGVAVWDGAGGNVGGRKHWSNWTDFEVSH